MEGKTFLMIQERVRPACLFVLFACFAGAPTGRETRAEILSAGPPERLQVDIRHIRPIEDSPTDVSADLVRPRPRVVQIDRRQDSAVMVAVAADSEAVQVDDGATADIVTIRDAAPATSQPTQPQSTWLQMQAKKRVPSASKDTATDIDASVAPDPVAPSTSVPVAPTTSIEAALDRKGSISFRKTPISEVVFLLSDLWKINIVAGENITGDVSGTFHEAPLREVLSAILTASGYSYQRTGRSLVVLPIDEVGSDDPNFVTETLRLPGGSIDETESIEAAEVLLSERGQIRKVGNSHVLIVDSRDRIERVRDLYQQLSPPGAANASGAQDATLPAPSTTLASQASGSAAHVASGIAYFSPQYTEASEMAESLTTALGDDAVIAVYAEENRIMVKGDSEILRLASEAIQQLDLPRAQVRITAMIYDVGLNELERLGVDWSQRPHSGAIQALSPSDDTLVYRNDISASTGLISDPAAAGAANLAIRTLNNSFDASALLQALHSTAESKLLADPSITVGDRREASIRIVQRIPILAADPVENSGVVFSQVQFEDAGVILNVTPRISRDGTIEMEVQPEYSVVVDFIDNNPVIDSRTAQTTLRVQNGHMFALGGLRQKTITETVRGVPFLKDMKHFGKLFRAHESQVRESELIVFIRPEIVVPCSLGTPRMERAKCVSSCQLGQIAHATHTPQTPYCGNINCPNHVPRPRINGGSAALGHVEGIHTPQHATVIDEMPSPRDVMAVIENEPVTESEATATFDEQTYLRLQNGLREMESSVPHAQDVKDVVIQDVEPPIHIRRPPMTTGR